MERYVEINGIGYELINCDVVEVNNENGEILGNIFINPGDWERILAGADPIKDGWEDGLGNSLSIEGWGDYYKGEIEE